MQTRKYEAIKSNHVRFLCCRVLLQNHFLSSPNNTAGCLFFERACNVQADGCELLGNVKWILYWVCPRPFWVTVTSTDVCLCECVGLWQSCIRAPQTHSAEGRVPGAECEVFASTPTHTFLVTVPTQTLPAPPSRAGRPFFFLLVFGWNPKALCKTRLSLAQTPTVLAAGTGLQAFPRGLNCGD